MSFLWILKSIRHRTEYSFPMKMWNCQLTASQTDDEHTVVVGISYKSSQTSRSRNDGARAPFSSFTLPQTGQRRETPVV